MRISFFRIAVFCISFLFACFYGSLLSAQENSFIQHTIQSGETLSALARSNKTTVGDIMRLNGMNAKSMLKVGQVIKIPSTHPTTDTVIVTPKKETIPNEKLIEKVEKTKIPVKKNEPKITQPTTTANEELSDLHYTVVKGDNLYKIAKKFKVTEPQLMEWNKMKKDIVSIGKVLIVGKEKQVATMKEEPAPTKIIPPVVEDKPKKPAQLPVSTIGNIERKKDTVIQKMVKTVVPKRFDTVEQIKEFETIIPDTSRRLAIDTVAITKAKAEIIPDSNSVVLKAIDSILPQKKDTAIVSRLLPGIIETADSSKEPIKNIQFKPDPTPILQNSKYVNEEGFFAAYFDREQIAANPKAGNAATFKSNSGWSDKKYYALVNDVSVGTMIRITVNNKSICAKVMGALPTIKADEGLLLRINEAAAVALGGSNEGKFSVTINY